MDTFVGVGLAAVTVGALGLWLFAGRSIWTPPGPSAPLEQLGTTDEREGAKIKQPERLVYGKSFERIA